MIIDESSLELYHEEDIISLGLNGGRTTSDKKQQNSKKNLSKLQELVNNQELIYDFQFYQMNYKTDYGFICCSQNSPSLVNKSCKLYVVPNPTGKCQVFTKILFFPYI